MKPLLGTYVEISIEYSDETTPINDWFSQAFARIDALQQKLSIHSAKSELNQINLNPNVWIPISRESRRLLQLAMILMHKSDGLFNPTLGANLLGHGIVDDLGFGKRVSLVAYMH
ncbi:FAD:protein FMN transferase [Pseudoalteromonas xiamenensis]|uniref:FAD:protein FMN transferase n=1 Tax=Pseudoalteromonas xiamenensis TaxID=882626 RepID=A0A975DJ84_9GAMM|nr:FAD:protein FMN transferase [Pseudoalteromonas xiamenensis]QTH72125.1 FAD:protein FMN transferase [Pseudoalteromonas xiamenensis]